MTADFLLKQNFFQWKQGYIDSMEYWEELILSWTSTRKLAAANIKKGQVHYKQQYDRHATSSGYRMGDLVLVKFPHEESERNQKLSHPWHAGLFNVMNLVWLWLSSSSWSKASFRYTNFMCAHALYYLLTFIGTGPTFTVLEVFLDGLRSLLKVESRPQ